jgi:hypothetical protein
MPVLLPRDTGRLPMLELETLDALQSVIYHADAGRLPEPNELILLLNEWRSPQ